MARKNPTTPQETDKVDLSAEEQTNRLVNQPLRLKEPEPEPARKSKLTPHETKRKRRQMSVTFPSSDWKQAIADQSNEWDMRPSDFLAYCVAYTMQAIEAGRAQRPVGDVGRFYHRAGEAFDLPWDPS